MNVIGIEIRGIYMYLLLPGIRMNVISKEHSPYPGHFRFGGTNNYKQLATVPEWLIIAQHWVLFYTVLSQLSKDFSFTLVCTALCMQCCKEIGLAGLQLPPL